MPPKNEFKRLLWYILVKLLNFKNKEIINIQARKKKYTIKGGN